jgi:hypothetical protein
MDKPIVIALLGRAGSGKSTAANYIVDNYNAERVSFAGPLKKLAKLLLELSDEQVYGSQEVKETVDPRYGLTPRVFMQRLGNGAREVIGKTVWVDACMFNILNTFSNDPSKRVFVIDDCRYRNEAEMVCNNPAIRGLVIKLVCPDAQTAADPNHPSEAEVDLVPPQHISATVVSKRSPGSVDLLDRVKKALHELNVQTTGYW